MLATPHFLISAWLMSDSGAGKMPAARIGGKGHSRRILPCLPQEEAGRLDGATPFLLPSGAPARARKQRLPYAGEDSGLAPESASGLSRNDFPPYGKNGGVASESMLLTS